MVELPSRDTFTAFAQAVDAITPSVIVGLARPIDATRVETLYSYRLGSGSFVSPSDTVPAALHATGHSIEQTEVHSSNTSAVAWLIAFAGAARVVSVPLPQLEPALRLWWGLVDARALTSDEIARVAILADQASALLVQQPAADITARLTRLELASGLLPALMQVLDIRDVFDPLSEIAKQALPHDLLTLGLLNDELTEITMHARSGEGPDLGGTFPQTYPPAFVRDWDFDIVDDRESHPFERNRPPTTLRNRSSLRVQLRLGDRVIGGLGFNSFEKAKYSTADVAVARRLADFVTVTLSHQRLAEQARHAEELRARAANLELLDDLLESLIDTGDLRQVFERISTITQKVLPHDAAWLPIVLPDGRHAKLHAVVGVPMPPSDIVPVPDDLIANPNWESEIISDVSTRTEPHHVNAAAIGFRSVMRVPVRLEGRFAGTVLFASRKVGAFAPHDILVARRIADRLALLVARDREVEAYRVAEAASAQTTNLEKLDDLLTTLVDTGGLPDVFGRISTIAAQVLPHDAVALMVRIPDTRRARVYASSGFPGTLPETMDIPSELLDDSKWEADIFSAFPADGSSFALASRMGLRSALRVRVRLDGQFAGALLFFSKTAARFAQSDILAASRIADRLAVVLARDREIAAAKRADEASARASKLESRVKQLVEELDARTGYRRVVGDSPEWRAVLTYATQVAPNDTTVLLLGESGTGKEVVARFVHRASPRGNGPFIALNCAALPDQLLEAELFGYERGAYTGAVQSKPGQLEQAAGGTLFLDEVGEMSLPAQAKFLRVLQEREFQRLGGTRVLKTDARIIAATNRDLEKAIAQNVFREDLYYRLNVFAILLPALRERPRDILPLSEAFLAEIGRHIARPAGGISQEARERLLAYHWPGNVRELRNILERASILCDGGLITPEHLAIGLGIRRAAAPARPAPPPEPIEEAPTAPAPVSFAGQLKSMEREMIEQALKKVRYNKSKAAKDLGLTRQQLYVRMKKYGLE
jgi:transcriptional regulator with GAF, ATPase, and Fis domain